MRVPSVARRRHCGQAQRSPGAGGCRSAAGTHQKCSTLGQLPHFRAASSDSDRPHSWQKPFCAVCEQAGQRR